MAEITSINPVMIRWAIHRSKLPIDSLRDDFPKLDEWSKGQKQPTFKQLEEFARKTMTPFGYLFLQAPPDEKLPIPDFRTVGDTPIGQPSPNLIETIQVMQRRQAWMRDYLIEENQDKLDFVGSGKQTNNHVTLAARMRERLGLTVDWSESLSTWEAALRTLRAAAERIHILVTTNGVVGLNTSRKLDPQEFRGFVLCDDHAPLIFVNGADSRSAQMFTLAHELAHIWLGIGGLFNLVKTMPYDNETERFCNWTAAEFLVPESKLRQRWTDLKEMERPFHAIARQFKVSPVVGARRALDLGLVSRAEFFRFYEQDQADWQRHKAEQRQKKGGPNFYTAQDVRLSQRFAYAVIRAAREGRLSYREAYQLTDLKGETFDRYSVRLLERMRDERR